MPDPLRAQIAAALAAPLSGDEFERSASSDSSHPSLLPVAGGNDAGLDGSGLDANGKFALVATVRYVLMRIAMIAQWLRAARDHREGRPCALRFALGRAVCQVGWVARLFLADPWAAVALGLLAARFNLALGIGAAAFSEGMVRALPVTD
jgi:hypothetical protein